MRAPTALMLAIVPLLLASCSIDSIKDQLVDAGVRKVRQGFSSVVISNGVMDSSHLLNTAIEQRSAAGISSANREKIEKDFQKKSAKLITLITDIQKADTTGDLSKKGPMGAVVVHLTMDDEPNPWCKEGAIKEIFIPIGLLEKTYKTLQTEHKKEMDEPDPFFFGMYAQLAKDVPRVEYDELLRFVLAHELTHIWLHSPTNRAFDRELEADAWGVLLSGATSPALEHRANAGLDAIRGGYETNNSVEFALLHARTGGELLLILYGKNGVQESDEQGRPNAEQRMKTVKEKESEAFDKYLAKLENSDRASYRIWHELAR